MGFIFWIVSTLASTSLVKYHAGKVKIGIIFLTFWLINHFNHWLPAFGGMAVYIFTCALTSKFLEEKSGLSYYLSKTHDLDFIRRVDALKIIILLVLSGIFVVIFSKIDPLRMIYLSGY